jgi:hypothetical protein
VRVVHRLVAPGVLVTRTVRIIALAAAVLVAAAGCTQSTVGDVYTPGAGSDADNNLIGLRNVLLVSDGQGDTALAMTVISKSDLADAVNGIAVQGPSGQTTPFTRGSIPVEARGAVFIGAPDAGPNRRAAIRFPQSATPGKFVTLVFSFDRAADLTVQTPVVPPVGQYEQTLAAATPKAVAPLAKLAG